MGDQNLISHHNIAPESNIKVTRITRNHHYLKKLVIVKQIFLVSTLRNDVQRTSWRMRM